MTSFAKSYEICRLKVLEIVIIPEFTGLLTQPPLNMILISHPCLFHQGANWALTDATAGSEIQFNAISGSTERKQTLQRKQKTLSQLIR